MANYIFDNTHFIGYDKKIDKNSSWCSYPSVSTIIGQLDKSSALMPWAQKMTIEYIIENWATVRELDGHKLTNFMDEAKKNALKKRDEAGQYGTDLHKILEMALLGQKIESEYDDDVEFYCAITDWMQDKNFNIDYLKIETPIVNIEAGYAGAIDLYDANAGILYDLKTSKQVYDTHILQLAGYMLAINILLYTDAKQWGFAFPDQVKKSIILHWDKSEKCLTEIDITQKCLTQMSAFLYLVDFYYSHKNRRVKNARTEK